MGDKLKTARLKVLIAVLSVGLTVSVVALGQRPAPRSSHPSGKVKVADLYGKVPLSFERNDGQTDAQVRFLARGNGYMLFLTPSENVLALRKSPKGAADVLRIKLIGSNPAPRVEGTGQLAGKSNYFIGNDPKKWRTNIPSYSKVWYRGVYPGIDLVYYGTNQRQLEYDFVVAPGASPNSIGLRFEGAQLLTLNKQGDVVIRLPGGGEVIHHVPSIYQERDGKREKVDGRYAMRSSNEIGFELAGYDRRRAVYIDPGLVYSTYLGGAKSDQGEGIAVDSSGFAYVTGIASSTDFPTTNGSFDTMFPTSGSGAAFVTKLETDGTGLVYSTYLGGGAERSARIAIDSLGFAYVGGKTISTNFPVTMGAFITTNPAIAGGQQISGFVSKLATDGSALVYSTYFGGPGSGGPSGLGDEVDAIAVDSSGFAYLTGLTHSPGFPTTAGAFQTTAPGGQTGFVTKLKTDGTGEVYSTYLGGKTADFPLAIAVDSGSFAYVTGETDSSNFPTTAGAFETTHPSGATTFAPFVTKVKADGSGLVYSTFLGGNNGDDGTGIAVDSTGFAYITGLTKSANFPTTGGAFQTTLVGTSDPFVAKLKTDGSGLVYATLIGAAIGTSTGEFEHIAIDSAGSAYVTGTTSSTTFPTTAGAFQTVDPESAGHATIFVTKLNTGGTALDYSTYLGGTVGESGGDIALDSSSPPQAYITGETQSADFPTTGGAFQVTFNSVAQFGSNAFVTKLDPRMGSTRTPTPTASRTPTPTMSATPTASRTPTPTASMTPTPTASRTPTPTASATPTATSTPTSTPTPVLGRISVSTKPIVLKGKPGKPKTKKLKVKNVGTGPLDVTGTSGLSAPLSSSGGGTIAPKKNLTINVTDAPTTGGSTVTQTLKILSNDPTKPEADISVTGSSP
jgi:hypothetical protein